jgi:hypothetical protein
MTNIEKIENWSKDDDGKLSWKAFIVFMTALSAALLIILTVIHYSVLLIFELPREYEYQRMFAQEEVNTTQFILKLCDTFLSIERDNLITFEKNDMNDWHDLCYEQIAKVKKYGK